MSYTGTSPCQILSHCNAIHMMTVMMMMMIDDRGSNDDDENFDGDNIDQLI